MKKHFLLLLSSLVSSALAYGQSQDIQNAGNSVYGSNGNLIEIAKTADGSTKIVFPVANDSKLNPKKALTVVDGVIGASFANVDSDKIESVKVLEATDAEALYGSPGVNGAIVIFTKENRIPGPYMQR